MIKPLSQKIDNLMDTEDKHYSFTDDHFVVTDSIDKVFKIIKETSNILLPLEDPIYVPVEIAVDKPLSIKYLCICHIHLLSIVSINSLSDIDYHLITSLAYFSV